MTLPSEVRYAILRNNNVIPLVPVDQLPFQLQGLSRRLEATQHNEQGWKVVGETQKPALMLSLRVSADIRPESLAPMVKSEYLSPDHNARKDLATTTQAWQPLRSGSPALHTFVERTRQALKPEIQIERPRRPTDVSTDRSVSMSCSVNRVTKAPGVEPDPSKKEYCTHWIRHNSCDFMQQGCRYKHEMPDREKLKELGFPHVPMWYRDKMAISARSSSWIRPRDTQSCDERQLSIEPPASRSFRPLAVAERRSRTLNSEIPEQSGLELNVEPVHVPNLIDLDDLSTESASLANPLEAMRPTMAMPHGASITITQPANQSIDTFASSLKEVTRISTDRKGNTNLTTSPPSMSSVQDSSVQDASPISWSSHLPQTIKIDKAYAGDDAGRLTLGPRRKAEEKNSKKSKTHSRRFRSPQPKLAEGPGLILTQFGLGKSQYATEGHLNRAPLQNKDVKRCSSSKIEDLQSQVGHHQRTAREQEKVFKATNHTDMHPRGATFVAANSDKAVWVS